MKRKIFISSVIEGYLDRRDTAEEAIRELNRDEGLNFEVIRIDSNKHPAENRSSREVCLDSIKDCDIYIGIFSRDNYGWEESPIGISPTHEEFRQALKENKTRIIFIEDTKDLSPKQKIFLDEVGKYVKGSYWNTFEPGDLHQLKHLVYRALHNLIKTSLEEYLPYYLSICKSRYEFVGAPKGELGSISIDKIINPSLRESIHKDNKKETDSEKGIHDEKISYVSLYNLVNNNQKSLIVGPAGAGKSTALKAITYSFAEQILFSDSSKTDIYIPVYLELKDYDKNLIRFIGDGYSTEGQVYEDDIIINWIKKRRFVFLFDGLDEMDRSRADKFIYELRILQGYSEKNRFVISSRDTDLLKDLLNFGFKKFELMHLSESDIELFIKNYLGKENKMFDKIKEYNLLNEAKNPLILWFMIFEFCGRGIDEYSNKAMLFKNVLEISFLKNWDKKHIHKKYNINDCTSLKIEILSKLAFDMINENDSIIIGEENAKDIIDNFLRDGRNDYKNIRNEILNQLVDSRILLRSNLQLSFCHRSYRDFFASLMLVKLYKIFSRRFIDKYATQKWEDSLLFFIGLIDDPSTFVNGLIKPFWQYFLKPKSNAIFRLSLSANCIGANNKISNEIRQKVRSQLRLILDELYEDKSLNSVKYPRVLYPIKFASREAIHALVKMKSDEDIRYLFGLLEEGRIDDQIFFEALSDCSLSLTEESQTLLLNLALNHERASIRYQSSEILRECMTREIALKLLDIINNKNEKTTFYEEVWSEGANITQEHSIRERAMEIIGSRTGKPLKYKDLSINPLIKIALYEECNDIRMCATSILRQCGDEIERRIIEPLIYSLHNDPNPIFRSNAAWALIYHPNSMVIKALIDSLDDENTEVILMAMHSLRDVSYRIKDDESKAAANKLLELFLNEDRFIASNAIRTFTYIKRDKLSDAELGWLKDLLKDESPLIRYRTAEALGLFKAKNAIEELKKLILIENYVFPWAYAIWAVLKIEPGFLNVIKNRGWEIEFILDLFSDDIKNARLLLKFCGVLVQISHFQSLRNYMKIMEIQKE